MTSGAYLWDHMGEAPVLLVPCLQERATPARATFPPSLYHLYNGLNRPLAADGAASADGFRRC
jgi:hypothetical protein